jgi:hypothetical protein
MIRSIIRIGYFQSRRPSSFINTRRCVNVLADRSPVTQEQEATTLVSTDLLSDFLPVSDSSDKKNGTSTFFSDKKQLEVETILAPSITPTK